MTVIRLAESADVEAVTTCVRRAYAHYVARIGREPAPMAADYAALVTSRHVYVLDDARGVIVLRETADALWIDNVAVLPEWQGHGFGRELLRFAERQALSAGLHAVRLYTHELMVENIALYVRLGFVEVDRRLDDGFRRVFLRKSLER